MTSDLSVHPFPTVLCPNCIQQGYLVVYLFGGIPVMSCRLCNWFVLGHWDNGDAVFPDPHVEVSRP